MEVLTENKHFLFDRHNAQSMVKFYELLYFGDDSNYYILL